MAEIRTDEELLKEAEAAATAEIERQQSIKVDPLTAPTSLLPKEEIDIETAPTNVTPDLEKIATTPVPDEIGIPDEDDLSPAFVANKEGEEEDKLIAEADALLAEDVDEDRAQPEPDPEDPLHIRLLSGAGAVAMDIGKGTIIEGGPQVVGGAIDAVQNTIHAVDSLSEWINDNIPVVDGQPDLSDVATIFFNPPAILSSMATGEPPEALITEVPTTDKTDTVTGSFIRSLSQFITGFIPMMRAVKAASGGAALTGVGQVAQIELAGAGASALIFDPHEERLSNLIQKGEAFGFEFANPVNAYLAASPDDSEAEGRFKNAIEGLGFGILAEGLFRSLRAIKFNRADKGVSFDAPISLNDEVFRQKVKDQIGDPNIETGFISDEAAEAFLRGDIPEAELPFQMNFAQFTSSESIEKGLQDTAQLFAGQIDDARRGVVSDNALRALADKLNMSPQELLNRQIGTPFSAEQLLAAKSILDASTQNVISLSQIAKDSTDIADIFLFKKMMNIHGALQSQFQGAASEAGRALRALQLPTGSAEKRIAELNAMLMEDGGPDQMRRIANLVSGIADPRKIDKVIKSTRTKRAVDMAVEFWYSSLLSGPQTHAVNVTSTGANMLWQIGERALAARIAKVRGVEGPEIGEASEMAYAMVESIEGAIRAAGRTLKTGESTSLLNKPEVRTRKAISASNFGMDGLEGSFGNFMRSVADGFGTFVRVPTTALLVEDEFFRYIGRNMSVQALAFRTATREGLEGRAFASRMDDLVNNPTKIMKEEAEDFSQSLTFTQELGQLGRGFQQATNLVPALKFIVPFIRTPVNLIKFAGTRTPLGLLASGVRADIVRGGAKGQLALARMAMGTGLAMAMVNQALKGNVTGAGPADPGLAATWRRTHAPFSIKVGDTWYSYNRSDPFGLIMGASASYAETFGTLTPEENGDYIAAIALAASKSVFNKTWMRGPAEFMDAVTQPDKFGERYVQQNIGSLLVPTALAQAARIVDPVWREVNSISDAIHARVPGYSSSLPPMTNMWGQDILLEGGLGPDIVSPIYKFGQKERPIDDYMFQNKINVDIPDRIQRDVEMDPFEHARFKKLAGNDLKVGGLGAYDTLNAIIEGKHALSSRWAIQTDGPEGGRSIIIKAVIQGFREAALQKMIREDEVFGAKVKDRISQKQDALRGGPTIGIGG
jgi:hypothetical protein